MMVAARPPQASGQQGYERYWNHNMQDKYSQWKLQDNNRESACHALALRT
jgi:hypothetical protein